MSSSNNNVVDFLEFKSKNKPKRNENKVLLEITLIKNNKTNKKEINILSSTIDDENIVMNELINITEKLIHFIKSKNQ